MPKAVVRTMKVIGFGLSIFLVCGLLTLGGVAYAYKDTYYPGVSVGGLKLGGLSQEAGAAAVAALTTKYMEQKVIVTVPKISEGRNETTGRYNDAEITTTTKDLGLVFSSSQPLTTAWELGHGRDPWEWLTTALPALFRPTTVSLPYTVDQQQIDAFINTQVAPQVSTPQPAKIVVAAGKVTVQDQTPGLSIDQAKLALGLAESLKSVGDLDTTYLRAPYAIVDSPVTAATVQPVADQLDKLGNLKISMTTDGVSLTPKREQILAWFTPALDPETSAITLQLDQDAVAKYLNTAARDKIKQSESLKTLTTALAGYIKHTKPTDPAKPLAVALTAKPVEVVDVTPGAVQLGLFEGKYVQVNLKDQRMYLVNGSTLERTYIVSTGKWSTPTPIGTFHIINKHPRAYSRSFGLYMPYWQNFLNGEYGLHELPEWPNGYKEGQSHLGTPVSHGCIRLGIGSAKEVYDWTEIGTPVVIVQS